MKDKIVLPKKLQKKILDFLSKTSIPRMLEKYNERKF